MHEKDKRIPLLLGIAPGNEDIVAERAAGLRIAEDLLAEVIYDECFLHGAPDAVRLGDLPPVSGPHGPQLPERHIAWEKPLLPLRAVPCADLRYGVLLLILCLLFARAAGRSVKPDGGVKGDDYLPPRVRAPRGILSPAREGVCNSVLLGREGVLPHAAPVDRIAVAEHRVRYLLPVAEHPAYGNHRPNVGPPEEGVYGLRRVAHEDGIALFHELRVTPGLVCAAPGPRLLELLAPGIGGLPGDFGEAEELACRPGLLHQRSDPRGVIVIAAHRDHDPALREKQRFLKRRNSESCELPLAVAEVKAADFSKGETRDEAFAVSHAVHGFVSHQDERPVLGPPHVNHDAGAALLYRLLNRAQGVLRGAVPVAAVRDDKDIAPLRIKEPCPEISDIEIALHAAACGGIRRSRG